MVTIVFEDSEILAVNKPSGMTVNKADTTRHEVTLQEWAEEYLGITSGGLQHERDDFLNRGGIVHRLDKETSGVILIAKTEDSFYGLQAQFKERLVEKTYKALVHGVLLPEKGEINAPIGRLSWNRMRFGVVPDGREAKTSYVTDQVYVLKEKKGESLSLVSVYPKTGRTHQIRVHMKHIGYPLFADFLYAGRKTARDDRKYLSRVFLHAYEISLQHPATKEQLVLSAPLADELQQFLDNHCDRIEGKADIR